MENVWKKESKRPRACYVDCFENIDSDVVKKVSTWLKRQRTGPKIGNLAHNRRKRNITESKPDKYKLRKSLTNSNNKRKSLKGAFEPELSFPEGFPGVVDVLELRENDTYGRHFVASCDIGVGKIIAAQSPFSEVVVCKSPVRKFYCLRCKKTDALFIDCENCNDVKFCSLLCRTESQPIHRLECNSVFHRIENKDVKLAVHMVLTAIKDFTNADQLIKHFETLLFTTTESTSPNGIMLNLTRSSRDGIVEHAYEAFQCLMTMQHVKSLFHTMAQQRFLMHLVLHFSGTIPSNAWEYQINGDKKLGMKYIHDSISLFNHSCAPNVFYDIIGNVGYCLTIRPIRRGEQVFVSYLGDRVEDSKASRQSYLQEEWEFECQCERCNKRQGTKVRYDKMAADSSLRYTYDHHKDYKLPFQSKIRKRLRDECAMFMQKFGFKWTNTLDSVTRLFCLACTHKEK